MEKKYNVVLGLMIFFFILVVGISLAWGLSSINKDSNDNKSETNKQENNEVLNETKTITLTDSKKAEINGKLQVIPTQLMITAKSGDNGFNNGTFTDQEMIYLITCWDFSGDDQRDANRKYIGGSYNESEFEYLYIKEQIKKVFEKDININNTTYKLENGKVITGCPTGVGVQIYKVKELVLNEKTNTYTLTFDNLEYGNVGLEEPSILNYSNSDIIGTYKLQYKKDGSNYILISLNKI